MPRHQPQPQPQPQPLSDVSASPSETPAPDPEFLKETAWIPAAIEESAAQDGAATAAAEGAAAINSMIPPELIAQALGPSFQSIFHFLASQRGAHWELKDFEKTALVQGWTPIVQHLLSKLGNSEQVMLTLAVMSTSAIVGGKVAQDAVTKRASLMASTKTRGSAASSASSGSAAPEKQPAQSSSSEMVEGL